jgi:SM-20-related protein
MISYLNNNWQPNDGGELMIYKESSIQKITPNEGKTILFKSNEMPHEVLLTNQPRMSVTGWLKNG